MAVWWISEAIPLSATALVPLVAFPLLGVLSVREAAVPYANPVILLMVGGFILALGMQRWNLHKRIALGIVARMGSRPPRIVAGFMLATALISMWVFNTTTTVMMLPIALSVIEFVRGQSARTTAGEQGNFAVALLIGIAYAATIGGMGTLIGTAPNAMLAGFMEETYGFDVSFASWMLVGIPSIALMLPLSWWILVRWAYPLSTADVPGQQAAIEAELQGLGPMARGERVVMAIVGFTALLWIFRPALERAVPAIPLNDTSIALLGALLLFVTPVEAKRGVFALDGDWARDLPWGVVILFGGGLALATGINSSGLAGWIGSGASQLGAWPTVAVVFAIVVVMVFLTEVTSNTAMTATFLPVAGAVAYAMGENPLMLIFPTVLAASCAFMMPVATPPNAVVFASGELRIADFIRAGIFGNLVGICVTMLIGFTVVRWVFDIALGDVPPWAAAVHGREGAR
jgi:sodium-dependent dicarboxylate transporter 2/3/5